MNKQLKGETMLDYENNFTKDQLINLIRNGHLPKIDTLQTEIKALKDGITNYLLDKLSTDELRDLITKP